MPLVEKEQLQKILEGALLAAGQTLSIAKMQELFPENEESESEEKESERPSVDDIREALTAIAEACEERGFELKEVASGFRFQVKQELAPWVNRLWEEKPQKYSRALLETLALIAYRQPITRGDIEEIRGVAVSSHITKTLLEREWVRIVGHRDVPGRPALYATTKQFLDYFNLSSLEELPPLAEIRDIEKLNQELDLDESEKAKAEGDSEAAAEETNDVVTDESSTDETATDEVAENADVESSEESSLESADSSEKTEVLEDGTDTTTATDEAGTTEDASELSNEPSEEIADEQTLGNIAARFLSRNDEEMEVDTNANDAAEEITSADSNSTTNSTTTEDH
ncbi:MAG: SMC-Scp complex subunit ScpB [Cellvibrionaceae bacterium]